MDTYHAAHWSSDPSQKRRRNAVTIPCDYLRTAPRLQNHANIFQPRRGVTKVRNSDKINPLPLMIFIWLHSQASHLLNKCLYCSIKSLFISKNLCFEQNAPTKWRLLDIKRDFIEQMNIYCIAETLVTATILRSSKVSD